jgi:hypothetical protein
VQIWAAAWIDSRDHLTAAYGAVLGVGDEARRRQLLEQLADLPIDLPQVNALVAEQSARSKSSQDADVWQAQQRIDLAKRFAEHYHEVEVKAQAQK